MIRHWLSPIWSLHMAMYPEAGLPSWEPVVAAIWLEHGVSHRGIQRGHTNITFLLFWGRVFNLVLNWICIKYNVLNLVDIAVSDNLWTAGVCITEVFGVLFLKLGFWLKYFSTFHWKEIFFSNPWMFPTVGPELALHYFDLNQILGTWYV